MPEDSTDNPTGLFPAERDLPQRSYRDLLLATDQQLRKDFHPHIHLPELVDDFSANDLRKILQDALQSLIRDNPSALEQILYRIDLNERTKKSAMEAGLEVLTESILRREALKVWIRSNYSEKM